ncbi:phosphotransferase [uncultured Treponema sp.]|uniref:phosphotransferase n=1 Tax=uncultured Treponema sp. TaxID=162155 RepID=UPI002603397D|nr:phosphotransferase [uncultured Treponema sp.]
MNVTLEENLVISPEGRITAENAKQLEAEIQDIINKHPGLTPVFDLERVEYISSAGLRMFLVFSKQFVEKLTIRNVSSELYEVFSVTGFTSLLNVEKKLRQISVEGCAILGQGAFGKVYRIDSETIVKVYNGKNSKEEIDDGQARAKYALIRGVPTAIAFDRVRVGDNDGAVFELLDAKTFQEIVSAQPERLPEMTELYFQFLRQLHELTAEKSGDLEDARKIHLRWLDGVRGLMPDEVIDGLSSLIRAMPEDLHIVHGDLHMKNLMLCNGEPMVIDMDTLCVGNKIFDIGRLTSFYKITGEFHKGFEQEFFNFPTGTCDYIFEKLMEIYPDPREQAKLMLVGYLNMAEVLAHHFKNEIEIRNVVLQKCAGFMAGLLPKVDSLVL